MFQFQASEEHVISSWMKSSIDVHDIYLVDDVLESVS